MTFKEYIKEYPVSLDITVINLSNLKLDDIYGIEKFEKLQSLHLGNNNIRDIEPLKNLPIKVLSCYNNPISNIDIILYFDNLAYLDIREISKEIHYVIYFQKDLILLKNKLKFDRRKRIIESL